MTAVHFTHVGTGLARGASRLRLTVRGRRVIASLLLAPIGVVGGFALAQIPTAFAGDATVAEAPAEQFETHTVLAGETLWDVAASIAGHHDVRDVVAEIMRLNGLTTASVQGGQQLALPNLS